MTLACRANPRGGRRSTSSIAPPGPPRRMRSTSSVVAGCCSRSAGPQRCTGIGGLLEAAQRGRVQDCLADAEEPDGPVMPCGRTGWVFAPLSPCLTSAQWSRSALISAALDIVERPLMPISPARQPGLIGSGPAPGWHGHSPVLHQPFSPPVPHPAAPGGDAVTEFGPGHVQAAWRPGLSRTLVQPSARRSKLGRRRGRLVERQFVGDDQRGLALPRMIRSRS